MIIIIIIIIIIKIIMKKHNNNLRELRREQLPSSWLLCAWIPGPHGPDLTSFPVDPLDPEVSYEIDSFVRQLARGGTPKNAKTRHVRQLFSSPKKHPGHRGHRRRRYLFLNSRGYGRSSRAPPRPSQTVEGAGERGKGRGGRRETQFYIYQLPIDRFSGFYLYRDNRDNRDNRGL